MKIQGNPGADVIVVVECHFSSQQISANASQLILSVTDCQINLPAI